MVHQTPPMAVAKSVPVFIHLPMHIIGVLYGQYICCPLVMLLVQWYINLTRVPINKLIGGSTHIWTIGAHGSSHITQGRG